jgi:cytochrome c oxidase assembly protein subunit 15
MSREPQSAARSGSHIRRLATVTAVLAYLQIVLGAALRHVPVDAEPSTFQLAVQFHLFMAAVLTTHIFLLLGFVLRRASHIQPIARLGWSLAALVCFQLVLGAATWIVKFAVPAWASGWLPWQQVAVQQGGWLQTHVITAHVATGSLILAASVAMAIYARRLLAGSPSAGRAFGRQLEAAV